jgi:hypothetical protein
MSDSLVEIKIDRSRCVLCGEPNECALAEDDETDTAEPCWCVSESFPVTLCESATDLDGGSSCICRRCLEKNRQESSQT